MMTNGFFQDRDAKEKNSWKIKGADTLICENDPLNP